MDNDQLLDLFERTLVVRVVTKELDRIKARANYLEYLANSCESLKITEYCAEMAVLSREALLMKELYEEAMNIKLD